MRIRCLKCNEFFETEDKKTNRLCSRCKTINKHFDSSVNLTYINRKGRHRHSVSLR